MNEDYVKTLVIDDPNYRPADVAQTAPGPAPALVVNNDDVTPTADKDATALPDADVLAHVDDLPDFDDTSWLT